MCCMYLPVGLKLCSPSWEKPSLAFGNPVCTYCYPREPRTGKEPQEGRWPVAFPSCLCCLWGTSACSTARSPSPGPLQSHSTQTKVYFHALVGSIATPVYSSVWSRACGAVDQVARVQLTTLTLHSLTLRPLCKVLQLTALHIPCCEHSSGKEDCEQIPGRQPVLSEYLLSIRHDAEHFMAVCSCLSHLPGRRYSFYT